MGWAIFIPGVRMRGGNSGLLHNGMYHGMYAVMHDRIANLWWWGKRSQHSRRMHNLQFYVSGMRPMNKHKGTNKHNTVIHTPVGTVITWAIVRQFPEDNAPQCEFVNPKPSFSKQINNNHHKWSKHFVMGNVDCLFFHQLSTNFLSNILKTLMPDIYI